MSEKETDFAMMSEYSKIFNRPYKTESNKDLFKNRFPDGWDIIDDSLIIIENKLSIKQKKLKQRIN